MKNYKEVYSYYEDTEFHKEIQEVKEVEAELSNTYKELEKLLNADTMEKLDLLIGKVARAYEMQGFSFGQNVCNADKTPTV